MASSEDRREVAARLRERAQLSNFCPFESFFVRLNVIIFGDNGWDRTDGGVFGRLADLIDPTCSVVRKQAYTGGPQMYKTLWCCSECGFPLAESKYKGHRPFVDENSCPRCGARVVSEHEE